MHNALAVQAETERSYASSFSSLFPLLQGFNTVVMRSEPREFSSPLIIRGLCSRI